MVNSDDVVVSGSLQERRLELGHILIGQGIFLRHQRVALMMTFRSLQTQYPKARCPQYALACNLPSCVLRIPMRATTVVCI